MDDGTVVLIGIFILLAFTAGLFATNSDTYDNEMKKLCEENSTSNELWNTGKLTQIKKILEFKVGEDLIQIYEYDRIFKFPSKIVYKNNVFLYTNYVVEKTTGDEDVGEAEPVKSM